jgi:hypothetical protein
MSLLDDVIEYAKNKGMDEAQVNQATEEINKVRVIISGINPAYNQPGLCALGQWLQRNPPKPIISFPEEK